MKFEYYNDIFTNPLRDRADVEQAVHQLLNPLKELYSNGCSRIHVGYTGASYALESIQMETFCRVLWGLAPLIYGNGYSDLWQKFIVGLKNGCNPQSEEYWGQVKDHDLKLVNMAALAFAMALVPEKITDALSKEEKQNLYVWLNQINDHKLWNNNWLFFRVLVNIGLKKTGLPHNIEAVEETLNLLEEFYLGDGWYSDGKTNQRDYYVGFAMHFYGLIYARLMETEDPVRSQMYKERAELFAKEFIYWFAPDGSSIPFGRSLTYRFAHSAFWSALVFAGVDTFQWGIVKGIVLRNLRWWVKKPIFTSDGILTNGYIYPNTHMIENYSGSGAPYWALKTFLCLCEDNDHPFWANQELELPALEAVHKQEHSRMLICRKKNHIQAFPVGQNSYPEMMRVGEKYTKFAYSNVFGFSVSVGPYGLAQGGFDSILAISLGDNYYRTRKSCKQFSVTDTHVYSKWTVFGDVEVHTWIIPISSWHIRIHKILTPRQIETAEGGYAFPLKNGTFDNNHETLRNGDSGIAATDLEGISGIQDVSFGQTTREAKLVIAEPNTNLMNQNTVIPTLISHLDAGQYLLGCLVLGDTHSDDFSNKWASLPVVSMENGVVHIKYGAEETEIVLTNYV